jgi:hypothetical protein
MGGRQPEGLGVVVGGRGYRRVFALRAGSPTFIPPKQGTAHPTGAAPPRRTSTMSATSRSKGDTGADGSSLRGKSWVNMTWGRVRKGVCSCQGMGKLPEAQERTPRQAKALCVTARPAAAAGCGPT